MIKYAFDTYKQKFYFTAFNSTSPTVAGEWKEPKLTSVSNELYVDS